MYAKADRRCRSCGRPIDPDGYVRVNVQRVRDVVKADAVRAYRRPEAHMVVPRILLCTECAGRVVEAIEKEVRA